MDKVLLRPCVVPRPLNWTQEKERNPMAQPDIIQTILKDSNYHLDLFGEPEIQALRKEIHINTIKGKETPFIRCPIRRKAIQLKPEELIRQLYVERLLNRYHYPRERVRFEHLVNFGREKKRADIVILDKDRADTPILSLKSKSRNSKMARHNSVLTVTLLARLSLYGQTDNRFRTTTGEIQTTLKILPISLT